MKEEKLKQKKEELQQQFVEEQTTFESTSSTDYFEQVEETPFTVIKGKNDKYFGVCADLRITGEFEDKNELIKDLKSNVSWGRITNVIVAIAKRIEQLKKIEENEQ